MKISNPQDMSGRPLLTQVAVSEGISGDGTPENPLTVDISSASIGIDSAITSNGVNAVEGKAIYSALSLKADSATVTALSSDISILEGSVSGIETSLGDKASAVHSHVMSDITDMGSYIETSAVDVANGVAGLNASGKIVASEIPDLSSTYVATATANTSNGYAKLDADGKVPTSLLPSYVSDVFEGYLISGVFRKTNSSSGEVIDAKSNAIYVDKATEKTYRWSGSQYTEISKSLALGTTSETAYPGDSGAALASAVSSQGTQIAGKLNVTSGTNANVLVVASGGAAVSDGGVALSSLVTSDVLTSGLASKADLVSGVVPSAQLPIATSDSLGAVIINSNFGIAKSTAGRLNIVGASADQITSRGGTYSPITPNRLNHAVTAALTDANHLTLTATQQATAKEVLGIVEAGGLAEIDNATDATAFITAENEGKAFIFTGDTDSTYTRGHMYLVTESSVADSYVATDITPTSGEGVNVVSSLPTASADTQARLYRNTTDGKLYVGMLSTVTSTVPAYTLTAKSSSSYISYLSDLVNVPMTKAGTYTASNSQTYDYYSATANGHTFYLGNYYSGGHLIVILTRDIAPSAWDDYTSDQNYVMTPGLITDKKLEDISSIQYWFYRDDSDYGSHTLNWLVGSSTVTEESYGFTEVGGGSSSGNAVTVAADSQQPTVSIAIVSALPENPDTNTLYFIVSQDEGGDGGDSSSSAPDPSSSSVESSSSSSTISSSSSSESLVGQKMYVVNGLVSAVSTMPTGIFTLDSEHTNYGGGPVYKCIGTSLSGSTPSESIYYMIYVHNTDSGNNVWCISTSTNVSQDLERVPYVSQNGDANTVPTTGWGNRTVAEITPSNEKSSLTVNYTYTSQNGERDHGWFVLDADRNQVASGLNGQTVQLSRGAYVLKLYKPWTSGNDTYESDWNYYYYSSVSATPSGSINNMFSYSDTNGALGSSYQVECREYTLIVGSENIVVTETLSLGTCLVEGSMVSLADGKTKRVEEITYDDELLCWDFDEGKLSSAKPATIKPVSYQDTHFINTFEDGSVLLTNGRPDRGHELFDSTASKFDYNSQIVGHDVYTLEGNKKLVSSELVWHEQTVRVYHIITERHFNLFADGVLTGVRLCNMYPIVNMRYDKSTPNVTATSEQLAELPPGIVEKLRMTEQPAENFNYVKGLVGQLESVRAE